MGLAWRRSASMNMKPMPTSSNQPAASAKKSGRGGGVAVWPPPRSSPSMRATVTKAASRNRPRTVRVEERVDKESR
jgi:hypothetical protein